MVIRFFLMWFLATCMYGVWLYVLDNKTKGVAKTAAWKATKTGIITLIVLLIFIFSLNNISGV